MSQKTDGANVETAINHLEAAIGQEVTGYSVNRSEGKVEILLGERGAGEATTEPQENPVTGMEWNKLVSLASEKGIYENGDDRESLEAKLAGNGVNAEPQESTPTVTIEEMAEKVESGDIEMKDAKQKVINAGLEKTDLFIEVNGECLSQRDCGHGAKAKGESYCIGCHKSKVAPKPDAFGISNEQATAAVSLWESGDYETIDDVTAVFQ